MPDARLPRGLWPLYAGTIVTRLGTFVVPYLTIYLSQDRGLSLTATGRVIAAGGAGLLLGNVVGGWLSDRIGRKPVLLTALAINASGLATLALGMPSAPSYALALALASMGAGMVSPAVSAWIADLTPKRQRRRAYAVNYVCVNVGMGLGPLLGGLVAARWFQGLFVVDIATTLACGVIIAATKAPPLERRAAERDRIRWTPGSLRLLAFASGSVLLIAPLMGLEYTVPLLVHTVLHAPLVVVGVVYSINAGCILLLGLPLERRVVGGRDPIAMMSLAGVLWTVGLAILALGLSTWALLLSTIVWTVGEMVASVVVPAHIANRVSANERGRFLAVPDAMRSVAGIAAPLCLGALWDWGGVDVVLWGLVAVPAVGAAAYGAVFGVRRHR